MNSTIPPDSKPWVKMNSPMKNTIVVQSTLLITSLLSFDTNSNIEEVTREPRSISILKKLRTKNKTTVTINNTKEVYANLLFSICTTTGSIIFFGRLFLNRNFNNGKVRNKLMRVGKARYFKNNTNGCPKPDSNAMSRFCGFPVGIITLPIVTPNANAYKNGFSSNCVLFFISNITGVQLADTPSLVTKFDKRPERNNVEKRILSGDLNLDIIQDAKYFRKPDISSAEANTNNVIRKSITSMFIDSKASCGVIIPKTIIRTPPKSIDAQGGIFVIPLVIINMYVNIPIPRAIRFITRN